MSSCLKHTCKECKHWTREADQFSGPYSGLCKSEKFSYNEGDTPRDGLQYWDYEGYSAGFATGEDFGCIHWMAIRTASDSK